MQFKNPNMLQTIVFNFFGTLLYNYNTLNNYITTYYIIILKDRKFISPEINLSLKGTQLV